MQADFVVVPHQTDTVDVSREKRQIKITETKKPIKLSELIDTYQTTPSKHDSDSLSPKRRTLRTFRKRI